MSTTTFAEPEIAVRHGGNPWDRCGNEVHSISVLIEWLMKHPRPCPIAELGRVAEGIQQVVLGLHYGSEELLNLGVKEIKSATDLIQATCGEWDIGDDTPTVQKIMREKWLWLIELIAKLPPRLAPPPPPPINASWWATALTELVVGMQETILLGVIKDPKVRQTIGRTVFDKTNVLVMNMVAGN